MMSPSQKEPVHGQKQTSMDGPMLFFDGVCTLCNNSVRFILKREKDESLTIASLQSKTAEAAMHQFGKTTDLKSLVLLENGKLYIESDAALRTSGYLRFPWNLGKVFLIVPRFMRDGVYRWIAKNRYKWFGKLDSSCELIPGKSRQRIIDA